jgi:diguanylate cyclase (GGDEF)-like protein/PAS domain S-box-containing protein
VNPGSRLDQPDLDALLQVLLQNNPRALVFAIDPQGLFTELPAAFPLGERHFLTGGHASALDLVVEDDVRGIIEAWTEARLRGCGRVAVHLANNPEQPVTLHYVDAMHQYGIYLGLLEMDADVSSIVAINDAPPLKPRVGLVKKNEMAFVLEIDQATTRLLGWTADDMVGTRSLDFLDPEDHPRAISNWIEMLRAPGARRRQRIRHRHKDGSWVWLEITNYNLLADPNCGYVLTEMLDITDEMRAQDALRASEHLLRRLAAALPQGVFQVDPSGTIVYRNERLSTILGRPAYTTLADVLAAAQAGSVEPLREALDNALTCGRDVDLEIGVRHHGFDEPRRCSFNIRALSDDAGAVTGAIVCVSDVTESVQLRKELEARATFDVLTGVLNRAAILQALEETLRGRGPGGTAVIFIDLDRFKDVNDRFGHAAGDAYLVEVAARLRSAIRESDELGRIGGDEFLVVCRSVESSTAALDLAHRLQTSLQSAPIPLWLQGSSQPLVPGASIGVAWSERTPTISADALVARADQAMYTSKRNAQAEAVLDSQAA